MVRDAIVAAVAALPVGAVRTLTWDQGTELAQHREIASGSGIRIFFCEPHSPWQRGTNENTNGLIRQYFPKGTDLNKHSADRVAAVARELNERPRKTMRNGPGLDGPPSAPDIPKTSSNPSTSVNNASASSMWSSEMRTAEWLNNTTTPKSDEVARLLHRTRNTRRSGALAAGLHPAQ